MRINSTRGANLGPSRPAAGAAAALPPPGRRGGLVALLAVCLAATVATRGDSTREYDLKAVLLFNLTRFAEWPSEAFAAPDSPLVIGILGRDPYGNTLDDVVRAESYGTHKIEVVRLRNPDAVTDCQMVVIGADETGALPSILARLSGRPVLTVSDFDDFARRGGMIGLNKTNDGKIHLRINLSAVKVSGVRISGKLIRVAELVEFGGK